ncbi:MAG: 16S rRNA methyltransferase [Deltaproteobacteria bacterium]|jgi:16S rRNA (cytosine967-C5)-methyltransferase|nr:16S rRNA methyltransferase [Deltaproteobacteria bacterium]
MSIASSHTSQRKTAPQRQDARDLAVLVLQRLEGAHAPIQAVLHTSLSRAACDPADAALCAELCYGVLRMEIRLHWLLARFLKAPEKLPPRMRRILLVALYALLFLDGMPEHAVVDWAVARVKRGHGQALARVANGCLRALCREGAAPRDYAYYRGGGLDEEARLALYHSLPLWIVRLWREGYGTDTAALLMAKSSSRPAAGFRVNRRRAGWEEVAQQIGEAGAQRLSEACIAAAPELRARLEERCQITSLLAAGRLSRQGAASQLALQALQPETWPDPLWDACAGQGTKSSALLELGKDVCMVSDTHLPRLWRIAGECRRLGLPLPLVVRASALRPPLRFKPGSIVLDAPCSGLGVLAARPDIRSKRKAQHVQGLLQIQSAMLEAAYAELSCGGHIAYLTCTQNPAENEEQVRAFLGRHPGAVLAREWNSPAENRLLEGMYAALLVKR